MSLEDKTLVFYNASTVYNSNYDKEMLWNSFGFDWLSNNPIISKRDKDLPHTNEFKSLF